MKSQVAWNVAVAGHGMEINMDIKTKAARAYLALKEFTRVSGEDYRDDIDNVDEKITGLITGLLFLAHEEKIQPRLIVANAINKFEDEKDDTKQDQTGGV